MAQAAGVLPLVKIRRGSTLPARRAGKVDRLKVNLCLCPVRKPSLQPLRVVTASGEKVLLNAGK
jgi:hypothetical protein